MRGLIALAVCSSVLAWGSPAFPATAAAAPAAGHVPAAGVSWGFFDYTTDLVAGLKNARLARATAVLWASVETPPGSGVFDWSGLDGMVQAAQAAGMSGVVELKSGNGSAFSDPVCRAASSRPLASSVSSSSATVDGRAFSACALTAPPPRKMPSSR